MSRTDDQRHLAYIRTAASTLTRTVDTIGRDAWLCDPGARAAGCYLLQTAAESATRLPDAIKARHPEVPWAEVGGMRNRLVHDYLTVDPSIVWSTMAHDLPHLATVAREELRRSAIGARPPVRPADLREPGR